MFNITHYQINANQNHNEVPSHIYVWNLVLIYMEFRKMVMITLYA